ncbi:hypothetical protein TRVL_07218 [Trypanosoma vivax]|nr:hypothetical protein TRVL_07218 [Trypanosoma vivax]
MISLALVHLFFHLYKSLSLCLHKIHVMLRRLHTRIIGMGSICGMPPSPMAEVFLKSLPPPAEVDYAKYIRFDNEERARRRTPISDPSPHAAPEPFYDIQAGSAGHKHVVLLTREGNLITFGDTRHGQTGAHKERQQLGPGNALSGEVSQRQMEQHTSWTPLYIDLDGAFAFGDKAVVCGSNFTIVYQPGGRRAITFGNNHTGQLGVGHKRQLETERGFAVWNPEAPWWGRGSDVIRNISCGFNHSILQLSSGALFSFGSNTWGELGIGSTVSPMEPTPIRFFEKRGVEITKVAAGNSFSLFLTSDGRVYGCGATNHGQLVANEFEPVPVPITRDFQTGAPTQPVPRTSKGARLIRIKDIACMGTMAAYLSHSNELLIQGSLPDYGCQVTAPRLEVVDQRPAIEHFRKIMQNQLGEGCGHALEDERGFDIVQLVQGPATLLVVYRNGCVSGLGANAEGQLQSVQRFSKGRKINVAKAFSVRSLFPVLFPAMRSAPLAIATPRPWFTCGMGFTLLFDHNEVYAVGDENNLIELPPSRKPLAPKPR